MRVPRIRTVLAVVSLCAAAAAVVPAPGAASPITYRTLFQDPGQTRTPDLSLEAHAIALINATPAGERIRCAFRDFNYQPVADALIAAHLRDVDVECVVDGGEREQDAVEAMVAAIGAERIVVCGTPGGFHSCIADTDIPGLQHNKFFTFSALVDGRGPIVLQTSKNFLEPSQRTYYNDMVEIAGDAALQRAYDEYFEALHAQLRTDHFHLIAPALGPNTIFTSPRFQPDPRTSDTIVDRMKEIDCSQGGSVRVANMAFRSERAVIMDELVRLHREGCGIDVIATNLDGDILAGLASAGIRVRPFFLRGLSATQRQVIVHSKFWLVDAVDALTGRRTKVVYAGSSNWRADQQRSDDLLLRIADDGVHDAYDGYWELIRSRVASDQNTPRTDVVPPATALTAVPVPNAAGWSNGDVTVRVAASDGHNVGNSGLGRLHVELSGAQTGTWELDGEQDGHRLAQIPVTAEGVSTVTARAEDRFGNAGPARSSTIKIDRTPPSIAGLPDGCTLWPPNHRMVPVADVTATDAASGVASLTAGATGGDAEVDGGSIAVRAEKAERGQARTYALTAEATDRAGNVATAAGECTVPHSRGH